MVYAATWDVLLPDFGRKLHFQGVNCTVRRDIMNSHVLKPAVTSWTLQLLPPQSTLVQTDLRAVLVTHQRGDQTMSRKSALLYCRLGRCIQV